MTFGDMRRGREPSESPKYAHECPSCARWILWALCFCVHCSRPGYNPPADDFLKLSERAQAQFMGRTEGLRHLREAS